MKRNKYIILTLSAAAVLSAPGCRRDCAKTDPEPKEEAATQAQPELKFERLSFEAAVGSTPEQQDSTRAAMKSQTATFVSDGFSLDWSVENGIGNPDAAGTLTKGAQWNTTDAARPLADYTDRFHVAAFNGNSGNTAFIPKYTEVIEYKGGWFTIDEYYWKTADQKNFFAYTNLPSSGATIDCTNSNQTLNYTLPKTPSSQTDILMAAYHSESAETRKNVPMNFRHALTAVVFKKGSMLDKDGNPISDIKITSIRLDGVFKSGTATQGPSGSIYWPAFTDLTDISQADSNGLTVDPSTGVIGDVFFLIPQELYFDNVTVTIKLNYGGTNVSLAPFIINDGYWDPGFTNVYTVNYIEPNLSVSVTCNESTPGKVMGQPEIKVKGVKNYVRAAIVVNILDSEGLIVRSIDVARDGFASASEVYEGSFSGTFPGTGWTRGDDGFFYYNNPVSTGNAQTALNPLFTSYTYPALMTGQTCKLTVSAQTIQYDPNKTCQQAFN